MEGCVAVIVVACVAVASSLAEQQVIFVDTESGTLDSSCWTGGPGNPCRSPELAFEGIGTNCSNTISFLGLRNANCRSLQKANECVPGMYYNGSDCECFKNHVIHCVHVEDTYLVLLQNCYCITGNLSDSVVGKCIFGCRHRGKYFSMYHTVRNHADIEYTCHRFNRKGQLCGKCLKNFSLSTYSYELACVDCTGKSSWIVYIVSAYIPLTAFYILVLVFRISAFSPQLFGFVTFSQAVSAGAHIRPTLLKAQGNIFYNRACRVIFALYGIWNLDFFRTILPVNCLRISFLQTLALDYAIAFYPLVLSVISYSLIHLYSRSFKPVVYLWRPFYRCCFSRLRQPLNPNKSIVNAFATFFLLSYVKIIDTSFALLVPTEVFSMNGTSLGYFLYYNGSTPYFGEEHYPYGVLAGVFLGVFILLPLLFLVLYPITCFQKLLNACRLNSLAVRTFLDSFQGYYKDGTEPGTKDCRYFSIAPFVLRIGLYILYSFTLSVYTYLMHSFLLFSYSLLVVIVRPYKKEFSVFNALDVSMTLLLGMTYILVVCTLHAEDENYDFQIGTIVLFALTATAPLIYISLYTTKKILGHISCVSLCEPIVLKTRSSLSSDESSTLIDSDTVMGRATNYAVQH